MKPIIAVNILGYSKLFRKSLRKKYVPIRSEMPSEKVLHLKIGAGYLVENGQKYFSFFRYNNTGCSKTNRTFFASVGIYKIKIVHF